MQQNIRIAILMTCFNRKEKTKRCLHSLLDDSNNLTIDIYLVNDGCTDGTPEMIRHEFPQVNILEGNGSLFWNQGMRFAFLEAKKYNYDFYLWVNDDVLFEKNIISKLIKSYQDSESKNSESIIVGYTMDLEGSNITYGGYRRKKSVIPLGLEMVMPNATLQECDTFNGNCVLVHKSVVNKIGINCDKYQHGFGDIDYGFMATKAGIKIFLTNYPVGKCEKNLNSKVWNDIRHRQSLKEKYSVMTSITHRPTKEWLYFTKTHGGPFWFIRFISPYIKLLVSAIITKKII